MDDEGKVELSRIYVKRKTEDGEDGAQAKEKSKEAKLEQGLRMEREGCQCSQDGRREGGCCKKEEVMWEMGLIL